MNYPASEDFPILEHLAACAGCVYLSDLRFLSTCQRRHLAADVAAIPCRAASLHRWNDALFYLTGTAPQTSLEAARSQLIAGTGRSDPPVLQLFLIPASGFPRWPCSHFQPRANGGFVFPFRAALLFSIFSLTNPLADDTIVLQLVKTNLCSRTQATGQPPLLRHRDCFLAVPSASCKRISFFPLIWPPRGIPRRGRTPLSGKMHRIYFPRMHSPVSYALHLQLCAFKKSSQGFSLRII